jgi:hypothetical protein
MKILTLAIIFLLGQSLSGQPGLQHALHFEKPAIAWDEAIPLGNGMVGALIWQKGDKLRFSLDRSDLWDERPMKGLHRSEFSYQWVHEQVKKRDYKIVQDYFDAPYDREVAPTKIPGGAIEFNSNEWGEVEFMHLYLDKAIAEVKWKSGIVLKTFVHATQPIGWFRLENLKWDFLPELISPKYVPDSLRADSSIPRNDVSRLGYEKGSIVKKGNTIFYHQPGWNGFSYSISIQWKKVNNGIEGVWSITSQTPKTQKQIQAGEIVRTAMKRSFKTDSVSHCLWWKNFWSKSSLHVPDSALENQWYRDQYKFGSCARKGAPPILLQGIWTADNGRLPPWKGDYHHDLNTEMSYWPAYSANHLDEAEAFLDHLDSNKKNYRKYTALFFGSEGIAVPGVTTLEGTEMGGWIQYALSPTISAWLAQHYYWQWKYSMDMKLLRQRVYPWFKEVALHLEKSTYINDKGFRQLPLSSSPEINNNAINAWFLQTTNHDLSLMKFVFGKAAEIANQLQLPADAAHYKQLLDQLDDYAVSSNNELMYAPGYPYKQSHRHFSHLMAIHPLGQIQWEDGQKSREIITNTIRQLDSVGPDNWNGYSYAWLGNLKARAKDGEGAAKALTIFSKAFCSVNSFHLNGDQTKSGYSKTTYRPFTLEGNFGFAAGLQEMLLQSYAGFIEVMPAVPSSWRDISFDQLRAEGAFLVSARKRKGIVTEIKIVSEQGGLSKLKLPFKTFSTSNANGVQIIHGKEGFIELLFKKGGHVTLTDKHQ